MKKRSCTRFLAACALASFAGFARAEEQAEAKPIAITLDEVRAFPEAYCRVPFELDLLYHGPRSLYNPFFTVFEPSSYANFAAWPAEAAIFEREKYLEDHPLFYHERKNTTLQQSLMALRPYTWFSVRCIVRSMAQGRAWIEVLQLTEVGAQLDTTDLRHLVKANALAANGDFERALLEIEMARLFSAPPRFIAQARREEGRVALAANQPERALLALQQAWASLPEDKLVAALLDRASAQVAMLRQSQVATGPGGAPVPAPVVEPAPTSRRRVPPAAPATPPAAPPVAAPNAETPVAAPVEPKGTTPTEVQKSEVPATEPPPSAPATDDGPASPTREPTDTPPPATDDGGMPASDEPAAPPQSGDELPIDDVPTDRAPIDGAPTDESIPAVDEVAPPTTDGDPMPSSDGAGEPAARTDDAADDDTDGATDEPALPVGDEPSAEPSDDELPPSDEMPVDEGTDDGETSPPAPDHGEDDGSDG